MASKEKKRRKSEKVRGRPAPPPPTPPPAPASSPTESAPAAQSEAPPSGNLPSPLPNKPESTAERSRLAAWFTPNRSALFVGAVTFVLYLVTLAPSVTCEDSGELITAAATGGVAHPPGYPVYTILARLFAALPIGNIAYRVNLMSAVFGALTASLTVLVAHEIAAFRVGANGAPSTRPVVAPIMAGLFIAASRDFWAQSVIAEVYTLNAALLAASLLCLLRGSRLQKVGYLPIVGALTGVSMAHHYPLALLALPSLVVFLFRGQKPLLKSPVWTAYAAFLVVAGLTFYLYLWAVAQHAPALNWGDPSSAARLWDHVTRSAYRKAEFQSDPSLADKLSFAGLFFRLWTTQWTPPVWVVFLPLGIYKLRDLPTVRDLLLGVIGVTAFGLVVIPGYPYNAENIQRFDELYLPVYLASALIMAEGATALVDYLKARMKGAQRPLWIATASAAVFPVVMHFPFNDLSEHDLAEKYNRAALEPLEPNALYLTSGDYTSFPALYLQIVEGMRPDVILANFTGDLSPRAVEYTRSLDPNVPLDDRAAVQRLWLEKGTRPVFVASKSDLHTRARTVPFGFVYKVLPLTTTPKTVAPDILSNPVLGERPALVGADDLVRGLVSDYYLMLGEAHAERGERKLAVARYADAVRVHSASKETVNNVASTCAEREYYAEAEQWMRQAAALSPSYVTPRRNLAKLLDSQGKRDEAIAAFEDLIKVTPDDAAAKARLAQLKSLPPGSKPKPVQPSSPPGVDPRILDLQKAISETPDNPALHNNLGNVYAESGDAQSAILAYEAALRVDPKYALAHKNLGLLYRDVLKDSVLAEQHFSLYKSLGGR